MGFVKPVLNTVPLQKPVFTDSSSRKRNSNKTNGKMTYEDKKHVIVSSDFGIMTRTGTGSHEVG